MSIAYIRDSGDNANSGDNAGTETFATEQFWKSESNYLLLNPRLNESVSKAYLAAWQQLVLPQSKSLVGIATSGSSGKMGRLILLQKEALLVSARAANERLQSTRHDIWLRTLPTYHVGGLQIGARAYLAGSQLRESKLEKWNPEAFYQELLDSRATLLSLVPTQLFDLVKLGLSCPKTLRAIIVGGARLESELHRAARALNWPALPSYGMTECGSQVATAHAPGDDPRLFPLSHVELRVGQDECLEIKSAGLLLAQISFSEQGAAALDDPKRDGWFKTEDRVCMEADGSMTILGRVQDFIKIGGEGVLLSRLEELFERLKLQLKYPHDASILAAKDERLGAKLVLLSNSKSLATDSLVEAFHAQVMPFERVRSSYTVPLIPRSALGKLLRMEALQLVGLEPPANVERN